MTKISDLYDANVSDKGHYMLDGKSLPHIWKAIYQNYSYCLSLLLFVMLGDVCIKLFSALFFFLLLLAFVLFKMATGTDDTHI